jgi:putative DNA primase/helicase
MTTSTSSALEHAREYLRAGLSAVAIKADGTKMPPTSWKRLQSERMTEEDARREFRHGRGVGIIAGRVSGNLEIIDIDDEKIAAEWITMVPPALLDRLPQIRTPSGCLHVYMRSPLAERNQKLAERPNPDYPERSDQKTLTLIETRGEGGLVVAPGSPPACHPTGRTYEHESGPPITETPVITAEEREILFAAARSFNEVAEHVAPEPPPERGSAAGLRPGDDWNRRASWEEILTPHGWQVHPSSNGKGLWTRPGKDTRHGYSATTGYCKSERSGDLLYVFSSSAAPLDSGKAYSRFSAYAILHHGGDFRAAAQSLSAAGYGDQKNRGPEDQGGNGKEKIPTDAAAVAKWILIQGDRFARDGGGRLFHFRRGAYSPRGERRVQAQVKHYFTAHKISGAWSNHKARETTEYLLADAQELWESPPLGKIAVLNGLLDVESRTLEEHTPAHLSAVQLPIEFDPAATCPAWEGFVQKVFPADALALAWELLAWLMIPFTGIQKAVLLMGEGGTGKSTFLSAVKAFLGRSNVSAMPLHRLESDRFAVGGLVGKLANICADLPSRDLAGTSVFKAITGGDELTAEHKFKDSFSLLPFARLIFSANRPPKSPDATEAFFERWIVVPFDRKFRGQKGEIPRHKLDAQLADPRELSGALNRALEALPGVLERGITVAPSMRAAHAAFRETTDPIQVWLGLNTVVSPALMVGKKTLKEAYNRHALARGLSTESDTSFALAVRAWKPDLLDAQRPWQGRQQVHCWLGIGLQAEPHGEHPSQRSHPYSTCSNARARGEDEGEEEEDRNNKSKGGVKGVNPVNPATAEADAYRATRPPLPPKAEAATGADSRPAWDARMPGDEDENS